MNETKFTPGPWAIEQYTPNEQVVDENTHYGIVSGITSIATLIELSEETEPNAKLIAAAPELFEALRLALPYIEGAYECAFPDSDHNENVLEAAKAAIAKAT